MPEHVLDQLYVFAQVAGVFIGFAALVSALITHVNSSHGKANLYSLAFTVIVSSHLMLLSFVPLVLMGFDLESESLWWWSALFAGVLEVFFVFLMMKVVPGIMEVHMHRKTSASISWIAEIGIVAALVAMLLGLLPDIDDGLYLFILFCVLIQVVSSLVGYVVDNAVNGGQGNG